MAIPIKKRDFLLLAIAVVILAFLWQAPESTSRVPYDDDHKTYYELVAKEGKKAAEKFCADCHNEEDIPFSPEHPSKARCLFCHKLQKP